MLLRFNQTNLHTNPQTHTDTHTRAHSTKSRVLRKHHNAHLKISTDYNKMQTLGEGKARSKPQSPANMLQVQKSCCVDCELVNKHHLFPLNNQHRIASSGKKERVFSMEIPVCVLNPQEVNHTAKQTLLKLG